MRTGIDAATGEVLTGWAHCAQSILTILTTLVGERVLKRDFGFAGPALQDAPQTQVAIVRHFSAIAEALRKWEPGFRLRQISVGRLGADGVASFSVAGDYYPNGYIGDYSQVVPMTLGVAPGLAALLARPA